MSVNPDTPRGARKPLSSGETGVKCPRPSPLSQSPLPASGGVVFGSISARLPAMIRSRFPSPSTSRATIPRIGESCARFGNRVAVNVPLPVFWRYRLANVSA